MAHGFKEESTTVSSSEKPRPAKGVGSRRIFPPQFKLQVLDSYRGDADCRGNQRATARKYGIHRRQIQKWLQMEGTLRAAGSSAGAALNLTPARQRGDCRTAGCLASAPSSVSHLSHQPPSSQPPPPTSTLYLGPAVSPPPSYPSPVVVSAIQQPPSASTSSTTSASSSSSDDDDDLSSTSSLYDQDVALDFTCAALSRRQFFSHSFKLEVIDAFYNDPVCCGNQRAIARKFGIHTRQVHRWLEREDILKAGDAPSSPDCHLLDLSKRRRSSADDDDEAYHLQDRLTNLEMRQSPTSFYSSPKPSPIPPSPMSHHHHHQQQPAPMPMMCSPSPPTSCYPPPSITPPLPHVVHPLPTLPQHVPHHQEHPRLVIYRPWSDPPTWDQPCSIHPSCVTKWLHDDVMYYKQAVKDINLYHSPQSMYS